VKKILSIQKGRIILEKVSQLAEKLDMKIYAVGGFVRDLVLGHSVTDIDFVVEGDALEVAKAFKQNYHSGKVVSYPRFGTAMLNFSQYKLEFVSARSEHYDPDSRKPTVQKADLFSDLSRRDFTINTLALDISREHFGVLIDHYHGLKDIKNRLIRTPLDPVITFHDDPLRIMRAIRFATVLEFEIEEKTFQAITETRERLKIISQERITEEFRKMMLARKPSSGILLMEKTGLLEIVLPELIELSGVDQRQDFHHKDVFDHTMQVLDNMSERTDKFELRLTALLHDIAKPQTKKFIEGTGWTFHGHEDIGARMAGYICRRMRLSNDTVKYVQKLVRLHLRPMQLVDDNVTDSAVRRLMVDAGEDLDDLMALCRADITSKNPQKVKRYLSNFDHVEKKMKEVEEIDNIRNFRLAIDGNTIMNALGIAPGPLVGQVKGEILDAVMDGKIPNEPEACFNYLLEIKNRLKSDTDGQNS
jgi:poly(A) polymerase